MFNRDAFFKKTNGCSSLPEFEKKVSADAHKYNQLLSRQDALKKIVDAEFFDSKIRSVALRELLSVQDSAHELAKHSNDLRELQSRLHECTSDKQTTNK